MADNDYLQSLLDGEEENVEQAADSAPDNKTIKQMRDQIEKLDRALKKAVKDNESLTEFKTQVVQAETERKVGETFRSVWQDETEADRATKLFFRGIQSPEQVTEEELNKFVTEFGPARPTQVNETEGGQEPGPYTRLSAAVAPTPEGEAPVQGVISSEDMAKLMSSGDKDAVTRAIEAGRFKKNVAPWPTDRV